MNKATIGAILFALSCWAYPIQTTAHTYAQRNIENVSEVHDQTGESTTPTNTPEREEESKETKEVNDPSNQNIQQPTSVLQDRRNTKSQPNQNSVVGSYSGRHYSTSEVIQLIKDYSAQYGIPADIPLCIAKAESGYNQFSRNRNSTASGVFQYLSSTWRGTDEGRGGLSVFDADANVRAAIKYMASRRSTQPWEVRNKCPQF